MHHQNKILYLRSINLVLFLQKEETRCNVNASMNNPSDP